MDKGRVLATHEKNGDYFDLLQVFSFDTNKNEKFIENYFRRLEPSSR